MFKPEEGKLGCYLFSANSKATKQMRLDAHSTAFQAALDAAGYSRNGQITHRPRHESAVVFRSVYNGTLNELAAFGGWDGTTKLTDYAQLPASNTLAVHAGFGSREHYAVVRALLDPWDFDEFRPMVEAFYPGLRKMKERMIQVCLCFDNA